MELCTKILEDGSTLLIMQKIDKDVEGIPWSPLAELVTIFAIQPRHDIITAARTLSNVINQPGVAVIKHIFSPNKIKSKKEKNKEYDIALMILVQVSLKFTVPTERFLPAFLQKERKKFVRRRSTTETILRGSGCKVTLIDEEKNLMGVHFRGEIAPEGVTVFGGIEGYQSKEIEQFLRIDRVRTRTLQDYPAPDLPVAHQVGTRVLDPTLPVGFPTLTKGTVLISGSSNNEIVSILQQLTASIAETGSTKQIFVIDTKNEMNGLINQMQTIRQKGLFPQVLRLGVNVHLNLCDVIIPVSPSGKKKETEAAAAWKAHIISQILLSSLHTTEYLTARYAVPLETQIRKTAENNHIFTLREVQLGLGNVSDVEENTEGVDSMFADMMAVEALYGILTQIRSFPEVNYTAFTGHYSNTLVRPGTMTFFQFGAQPPLIRRATVAFLLHYLSQTMKGGCVVLTHAAEFLRHRTAYSRQRDAIRSSVMEASNLIAEHNLMILGSHSLEALAANMDTFEEINNCIYLKMNNAKDREIVIDRHELEFKQPKFKQQRSLGIIENEGLLFREDAQNVGFHFKLKPRFPVDLNPVQVTKTKQRGSETLGLTPIRYEFLMKLLKLLTNRPCRTTEALALIDQTKHGEISLDHFQSLELFETELEGGATYWIITQKGREYYNKQHEFVNLLPVPLTNKDVRIVQQELNRLESFYDISSSHEDRLETNTKVKLLVGRLLNYTRHLRATSIPWLRIAEYHDLVMIDSLEWQDFRNLFDLAHAMVYNLLLEIRQLQQHQSTKENDQTLQASTIQSSSDKKDLDDYLPEDNFTILQQLSQELGLEPYPKTGILDLYFALHTQGRSLFDELKIRKGKLK